MLSWVPLWVRFSCVPLLSGLGERFVLCFRLCFLLLWCWVLIPVLVRIITSVFLLCGAVSVFPPCGARWCLVSFIFIFLFFFRSIIFM